MNDAWPKTHDHRNFPPKVTFHFIPPAMQRVRLSRPLPLQSDGRSMVQHPRAPWPLLESDRIESNRNWALGCLRNV